MSTGKIISLIVVALVVLGIIFFVGSDGFSNTSDQNVEETETEEEVFVDDNMNVGEEESNEVENQPRNLPSAVFNTFGEIVRVGSDFITVDSDASHMEEGSEAEITVNITSSTNILDAGNNSISLSDLSVGDAVSIEGAENIKDLTEFEGSNIKLVE